MKAYKHVWVVAAIATLVAIPGAAQQNDQHPPRERNRPVQIDPTYQRLADETGGTVYDFDREFERAHPGVTGAVMAADYLANRALVTTHGEISGPKSFEAPLEGTESKLVVTVTGNNLRTFELHRPDGSVVAPDAAQNIYAKLGNGGVFVVANPEAGTWTAILDGNGNFSLRMNVAPGTNAHRESPLVTPTTPTPEHPSSDIEFDTFEFQQLGGRPGHQRLFKIDGYPVATKTYPVEARISGDLSTVRFEFRSADNQPLQVLDLKHDRERDLGDEHVFTGEAPIPTVPFRIYAAGLDQGGRRYQRSLPHLLRPQAFSVGGPGLTEWEPGQSPSVSFTVTNFGDPAEFEATIIDSAKFLTSEAKFRFSLAAGEARQLDLAFEVPLTTELKSDTIIVTVQRGADPNAINHAIVEPSIYKRD